ncbi:hypothetical protein J2Z49_002078 [Desulfofundulus luciae]|uniref:Uncharacterized protein n=1 Tax=Desulfofundulus luciae TaxID=74702 RepID=A0ABU0B2L5_9FIRM|nr:hypothetical protein [Desulfofundulus luciae]MDQ0286961.1 hypothetical protein [Desulfofundulus luciae]
MHNKGEGGDEQLEHPEHEKTVEVKGNRKEDLNRIRGAQRLVDPERGPENKRKKKARET